MTKLIPIRLAIGVWLLFVSGCATYHPQSLPAAPDLAKSPALTVAVSQFNLPGLQPHVFNPTNGLDETTVALLAVLNNPQLKAERLQAGVANAQLLEAGLLPDPQVRGGLSRSTLHTGYDIGLSEDLQALITRGARKAAAKARARQVNLQILWQEWQVAEKARELFIQAHADRELLDVWTTNRDLLAGRYNQDEAALRQNNLTADKSVADFALLAEADTQLRQLRLQANETRHALNQLLGLRPGANLRLAGRNEPAPLSSKDFENAIAALPYRRADLLALRAGYESQEQRLREAILAQFPSLSAGVEQARSAEEGLHTIGLTVNLTLPLFNRNRGQIAIQRASRAVLHQTYQARLDQAVSDADRVWQATRIMALQWQGLRARRATLERAAAEAERYFQEGSVPLDTYVSLRSNVLTEEASAIHLRVALEQAQAVLETLLGQPIGDARTGHAGKSAREASHSG